ncbi:ELO family [Phycomyces nitens]|nr:ELO family [Phycomyces nitens]
MSAVNFSIDRPFGVYLFKYFDALYTAVLGTPATKFAFVDGVTPLSTLTEVVVSCLTYYGVIFGGRYIMRNSEPLKCKLAFQIHNILITIVSACLLALIAEQVIPKFIRHGFHYTVCDSKAFTTELELLYYINYLVKYWELLDTVFLVIKKKKLEFLHYFHHSMTMALCYSQLTAKTPVSCVPIGLNLGVHVVMYYYYYLTTTGVKIWWKKHLTTMQISQFIIDLLVIGGLAYSHFAFVFFRGILPTSGTCTGTETAAIFGSTLLTAYLLLFVNFYRTTYNAKEKALKQQQAAAERLKNKMML